MRECHYSEGRTCSTCGKRIVDHSKHGRCHSCFMKAFNSDPEVIARRSEGLRRKYREDPEAYASKVRLLNRCRDKALADPETYAKFQAHGRKFVKNLKTPEAIARKIAAMPKMAAAVSATKMAWCPPEYRDEYRSLTTRGRKRMKAADAREYILAKAADEAALKHVSSALEYLKRLAPVKVLENGYQYGNAILRPSEVVERAKLRGWQPDRWAA